MEKSDFAIQMYLDISLTLGYKKRHGQEIAYINRWKISMETVNVKKKHWLLSRGQNREKRKGGSKEILK